MLTTSETLIGQIREPGNKLAWSNFVRLYSPPLFQWIRQKGLQDADASDVVQQVFQVLVVKLPEFDYDRDRSFRKWFFCHHFKHLSAIGPQSSRFRQLGPSSRTG